MERSLLWLRLQFNSDNHRLYKTAKRWTWKWTASERPANNTWHDRGFIDSARWLGLPEHRVQHQ